MKTKSTKKGKAGKGVDLTQKKSNRLQSRGAIVALSVFIALILSAIAYFLVVGPQFDRVGPGSEFDVIGLEAQVKAKNDELTQLKAMRANLQNITEDQIDLVSRMLPSKENIPELLSQFEVIARQSGINITSIAVAELDETESVSTRQRLKAGNAVSAKKKKTVETLTVQLGVTAFNYQSLKLFLEGIQTHARLLDVDRFTFGTENPTHTISLRTYFLEP